MDGSGTPSLRICDIWECIFSVIASLFKEFFSPSREPQTKQPMPPRLEKMVDFQANLLKAHGTIYPFPNHGFQVLKGTKLGKKGNLTLLNKVGPLPVINGVITPVTHL